MIEKERKTYAGIDSALYLLKSAMNFIIKLNKNITDHKTKLENLVKAEKTDEELNVKDYME